MWPMLHVPQLFSHWVVEQHLAWPSNAAASRLRQFDVQCGNVLVSNSNSSCNTALTFQPPPLPVRPDANMPSEITPSNTINITVFATLFPCLAANTWTLEERIDSHGNPSSVVPRLCTHICIFIQHPQVTVWIYHFCPNVLTPISIPRLGAATIPSSLANRLALFRLSLWAPSLGGCVPRRTFPWYLDPRNLRV